MVQLADGFFCFITPNPQVNTFHTWPLQVLSIQSFKRGMPLVPSGEPIITIDAGERLGLKHWARFQPGGSLRTGRVDRGRYVFVVKG